MKTGVIFYPESQNLGDDIQTYAVSKLVKDPLFIDREHLNEISEPLKAIISGWFMTDPNNFPPSKYVHPHFISFHGKASVIKTDHYEYFKKYEPIGCRDYDTLALFDEIGIKAYYSGCATLTIDAPDNLPKEREDIIIVDILRNNYTSAYREFIKENIIPKAIRDKASYFSHFIPELRFKNVDERMLMVESVLRKYANAKLVITSLIHCALPCLAMGTPVLFIDIGFDKSPVKRDRFKGITDLMNVYSDLQIPFSNRNFFHTSLRLLRFHHLFKNKVDSIPLSVFTELRENEPFNEDMIIKMKKSISDFERIPLP